MYRKIFLLAIFSLFVLTACNGSQPTTAVAVAASSSGETAVTETHINLPIVLTDGGTDSLSYPVVDTGQAYCYDGNGAAVSCASTNSLTGQDAQYAGQQPNYTNNGDGTISDNTTGLTWQQSPNTDGDGDIDAADKLTYAQAETYCQNLSLAGYADWRLPAIKELYSLIDFSGVDPSGYSGTDTSGLTPFIDTTYFDFAYGDTNAGQRIIDAQYASSTLYVSTTMNGNATMFGVNFADGRIKGYGQTKAFYVICARGNEDYGVNDFTANGDATITDNATGLVWMQDDSGTGLNWGEALTYCENANDAGYDDWRLPNAKELQSIVDYGRSPDTTNSAAIDSLFNVTRITNEAGQTDYPAYWSSTTHANMVIGANAAYVNFGRSMGYMNGTWTDVHGAGAQRSDPKSGDPSDWPTGHGPQGDAIRIYNYVRCVRAGDVVMTTSSGGDTAVANPISAPSPTDSNPQPQPQTDSAQPAPQSQPDLVAAAAQLGVSEQALRGALGAPPPDLAAAAAKLGVSESDLMAALGLPAGLPPGK